MFFLPFLAGAAVIGAGAYYISKIIQTNKPITIMNVGVFNGAEPKTIFIKTDTTHRRRSEIGCTILACKDKAVDKGIIKSYVDFECNDKAYRLEGPSISPELKSVITC